MAVMNGNGCHCNCISPTLFYVGERTESPSFAAYSGAVSFRTSLALDFGPLPGGPFFIVSEMRSGGNFVLAAFHPCAWIATATTISNSTYNRTIMPLPTSMIGKPSFVSSTTLAEDAPNASTLPANPVPTTPHNPKKAQNQAKSFMNRLVKAAQKPDVPAVKRSETSSFSQASAFPAANVSQPMNKHYTHPSYPGSTGQRPTLFSTDEVNEKLKRQRELQRT